MCSIDDGHCRYYYCMTCDGIHLKDRAYKMRLDQQCKCQKPQKSNLYTLWKLNEDNIEIEFYYDKIEKVYLHLAENLIETKQVLNQLSTLVKRLLEQFKNVVAQNSNDLGQTNVLKHKINLVHPFSITAKPKTFDLGIQRKIKQKI